MQTKTRARYIMTPLFVAAMLFAQNAHAGWIMDWIKCSEDCGWICGCDGGELAIKPQNPEEKKAAEEIMRIMESFKSNVKSLSPEAKKLLKRLDSKANAKPQPGKK